MAADQEVEDPVEEVEEEEEPVIPDDDAEEESEDESEVETQGDEDEPEQEPVPQEPDDPDLDPIVDDALVDELLTAAKQTPAKPEAKAPATDPDEFDVGATEFWQAELKRSDLEKRYNETIAAIQKADEEGDEVARIEAIGRKTYLAERLNEIQETMPDLFQKAEKQKEAFVERRATTRLHKTAEAEVGRLAEAFPSVKKYRGIQNAIRQIIYRGELDQFAGLGPNSPELEKAIVRYALKNEYITPEVVAARKQKDAPAQPAKARSLGAKTTTVSTAKATAPAATGGGRTWNGEKIPPQYSTADYKLARESGFTAEDISVKYKGKNITKGSAF